MTTYIFTISFLDENNTIEYSVVKGVYDNKKDARDAAIKAIKAQRSFWENSRLTQKVYDKCTKVFLHSADGFYKVFCLQEMEMNKTH